MQIFKEKPKRKYIETNASIDKVCASCGYKRKQTDDGPKWQCPSCKVAYHKVTQEYKSEYNKNYKEQLEKEKQVDTEKQKKAKLGQVGLLGGSFSYIKGLGSACAGIAASPFFKVLGVIIGVISVAYIFSNTLFK